ncbi:hypothetical protein G3A56_15960 [Rhizobium oryzihabitans]|uniref:Uncharacterized protein n=1 Tax=Rhizobium oryzihabitans TaxID=2267833 RepID=A0A7L5BKA0_9HYPH|nr:hypothetical protein [Rhizobium oryzihabitans]QIB39311.1 hypothetical protein G3A56_15960 [Rhizobium oryzihabitans]
MSEKSEFQLVGYQKRPRNEYRSATVSGTPWSLCSHDEATNMFERWPGFEYREIYARVETPTK